MLMEFTHQNLNSDMNLNQEFNRQSKNISPSYTFQNHPKQNTPKNQNSQFKDFLSIVDDKFNQSNGILNKKE